MQNIVQIKKNLCPAKPALWVRGYCIHQGERDIGFINSGPLPPRYLLSGASGLLGSALRGALAARNCNILQLVRRRPTAPNEFQWNPTGAPAISNPEAFEDLTAAFHLSGANLAAHRWSPRYKREMVESRVESTRALSATLARLRRPPQVLMVASAIGIYGNRGEELLDETSPTGTGFLADLCRRWEEASRPAARAGIRVIHLRFGVVLAPGGGALGKMLPFFRMGLGGKLGDGRQYMSWIAQTDAVAALLFLLDQPAASGSYNITAPNPVSNAQFTRMLAAQLHRPAFFSAPAFALRLGLGEMANEGLLASTRAYPARLMAAGFQFAYPNLVHALPAVLNAGGGPAKVDNR